ncbi:MAG: hypothetical protein WBO32_13520, partial [Cyclobacteriaceae bacterium]
IGTPSKAESKLISKTKQDVAMLVIVETLTGQTLNYLLSRYSNNYFINDKLYPIPNINVVINVKDLLTSFKPKQKPLRFKGN